MTSAPSATDLKSRALKEEPGRKTSYLTKKDITDFEEGGLGDNLLSRN
jgi:hypothetical protein